MYYTPETLLNHVFEDLQKTKAPNNSGGQFQKPECGKFGVILPGAPDSTGGAPDTVRWHTGQSGVPDQGSLRLSFALFV
jgi:hypothetical protein